MKPPLSNSFGAVWPHSKLGRSLTSVFSFFSCHVASDSFVTGYDCTLTSNTQNFTLAAFRFPGSTDDDLIYFHCQAAVCLTSNADSICKTQCDACPGGSERKKRGLGHHSRNELAEENLVLGPYKIIDNSGSDDDVGYRGKNGKGMLSIVGYF